MGWINGSSLHTLSEKIYICTVPTTRMAHLKLDWPTFIFLYCLPYKNGELKNIVLQSGHHNSFLWSLYEKGLTLGL